MKRPHMSHPEMDEAVIKGIDNRVIGRHKE